MTEYMISFNDGQMIISDADLPEVAAAAVAVVHEARAAGVWVFGGGLLDPGTASVVAVDGTVTDGPFADAKNHVGGFSVVDVATREEALEWAAKLAVACRCAQEVRAFAPDAT
ncbi:hypothetical protein Afil01_09970 [Actinorhabdospora filicis]|uniref:YCII-related domain-containing protein n=1 Tax=Actinorhabdospora filicis TaxID=1785913 RepID=A0A9W6W910_9ACTN|nr:YciI family protein [Actinorhabdospora filicis]GLZ76190.1 hypothetical protein Afil01_09970 [Actinorhabdospora filicis]